MKLTTFRDNAAQAHALAERLVGDMRRLLKKKQRVTLCLPGGTTPGLLFDELSKMELDWKNVHVLLSDERWVSTATALSNEALLRNRLACNAAQDVNIVSYYSEAGSMESTIAGLNEQLGEWMPLDLCVLGMGLDGHFASLFPDIIELEAHLDPNGKSGLIAVDSTSQPVMRVSLTLAALASAESHYLLVRGSDKKKVLETAALACDLSLPISHLLAACPKIEIYYA